MILKKILLISSFFVISCTTANQQEQIKAKPASDKNQKTEIPVTTSPSLSSSLVSSPSPQVLPSIAPSAKIIMPEYDFSNLKVIKVLGDLNVERINNSSDIRKNYISFFESAGDLRDNKLYDDQINNFNYDGIYRVTHNEKFYYFRFGFQRFENKKTTFSYVLWLDKNPPAPAKMKFEAVQLPLIQQGNIELSTIGDSITWFSSSQYLRRELDKLNPDLKFIGSRTDLFGYGHEGEGGNRTQHVVDRLDRILPAQNYTLLIGTNDNFVPHTLSFDRIQKIINALLLKKPDNKVYLLTILPVKDSIRDSRNQEINKLILSNYSNKQNPRVIVIDTAAEFRKIENWLEMFPDGVHPNDKGCQLLAKIINENLQLNLN